MFHTQIFMFLVKIACPGVAQNLKCRTQYFGGWGFRRLFLGRIVLNTQNFSVGNPHRQIACVTQLRQSSNVCLIPPTEMDYVRTQANSISSLAPAGEGLVTDWLDCERKRG